MRQLFKRLTFALLATSLLLTVPVALAQEAAAEAPTNTGGLMVLAFLLGVGGILVIGILMWARDSFRQDDETKS